MIQFTKRQKLWLILGIVSFVCFVIFTLLVAFVDVDQVGLSKINHFFWQHCGKHEIWERITDYLGYVLILVLVGILAWQIWQWIMCKKLARIDWNLLMFDVIMVCLAVVYVFFEVVVINYRPAGDKASYPSSHAMLFATVLPLLIYQVWHYLQNKPWRIVLTVALSSIQVIGLVGRLLAGVHWFTDILGGVIISCCLDCFYIFFVSKRKA
ncbi:MAG: phosphatase PAP2 family protein [Clostridia bacterium]|nr:phosphatase PAP2 family protein [Clostridia bacterium]